jgi:hypothetical protein
MFFFWQELAKTTLASKVLGGGDVGFFANMCVEAVQVRRYVFG